MLLELRKNNIRNIQITTTNIVNLNNKIQLRKKKNLLFSIPTGKNIFNDNDNDKNPHHFFDDFLNSCYTFIYFKIFAWLF